MSIYFTEPTSKKINNEINKFFLQNMEKSPKIQISFQN